MLINPVGSPLSTFELRAPDDRFAVCAQTTNPRVSTGRVMADYSPEGGGVLVVIALNEDSSAS